MKNLLIFLIFGVSCCLTSCQTTKTVTAHSNKSLGEARVSYTDSTVSIAISLDDVMKMLNKNENPPSSTRDIYGGEIYQIIEEVVSSGYGYYWGSHVLAKELNDNFFLIMLSKDYFNQTLILVSFGEKISNSLTLGDVVNSEFASYPKKIEGGMKMPQSMKVKTLKIIKESPILSSWWEAYNKQ